MKQIFKPLLISLFILLFQTNSFAQYKRMSVGLTAGTNNFSCNYAAYGVTVQYNFKKVFSLCTGLTSEESVFNLRYYFNTMGPIREYDNQYKPKYIGIPLLLKASFGKKRFFFVNIGINYNNEVKSNYTSNVNYTDNSFYEDYTVQGKVIIGNASDLKFVYGFGVSIPIIKRVLVSFEARGTLARDRSYPTDGTELGDYHCFYGNKLFASIAYQFNWSKKSDYTFKSYYPTFKRSN